MLAVGRTQEHCFAEWCHYHDDFEKGIISVLVCYDGAEPVMFAVLMGTTLVELGAKHSGPPPLRYVNEVIAMLESGYVEEVWDVDGNIHRSGIVQVNGRWVDVRYLLQGLTVEHSLNLNNIHVLHSLPNNLTVRGDLSICKTQITELPSNLVVEGKVDTRYTAIHDIR
jgi:hypothetical protein